MEKETSFTIIMKGTGNGSVIQILKDGPVPPVVPGAFLVLDFSLGFCLNLVLVFTVVTCPILRRLSFNRILLHLCVACALDCFLNVIGAVIFVAVTHLDMSPKYAREMLIACRVNAALTQWTTAVQSVALAALAVDRVIKLRHEDDPKSDVKGRLMKYLPALMWVYGSALVAPIVATSHIVGVRPFPDRYSCGVVPMSEDSEGLLYPSLLLILGYLLPWTVIVSILTIVIQRTISTRRRLQQLEEAALQRSQGRMSNSTMLLRSTSYQMSWSNWLGNGGPMSWEEVKFYFLSLVLFILYIMLLIPHILCVNIPSITTMPPPAPSAQENSSSSNSSVIEQAPELTPVLTGNYDCLFVWCRYNFTICVPIAIIVIHKEVRKKCEHMFCCCCCRSNAVVHLDEARSISATVEKRAQISEQEVSKRKNKETLRKKYKGKKDKYRRIAHYRTPVLFATSEGLHLRLVDDRLEDSYYLNETDIGGRGAAGGKEQCWTVEPRFLCEFCDVALLVTTPTESIGNPDRYHLQQSYGASMNLRRDSKPPVFGEDTFAEGDLHLSDDVAGESSGEFGIKTLRKENEKKGTTIDRNNLINDRSNTINNNRKLPRVRFAQTVSEIPLSESGVWSAPEDQGSIEQGVRNKRNEVPDISANSIKSKPKINVTRQARMDISS